MKGIKLYNTDEDKKKQKQNNVMCTDDICNGILLFLQNILCVICSVCVLLLVKNCCLV